MRAIIILLFLSIVLFSKGQETTIDEPFTMVTEPFEIEQSDGKKLVGNDHLIFLPENRANPNSRLISVHFYRFPAREKAVLPPVIYLPGGPGTYINRCMFLEDCAGWRASLFTNELITYNGKRDVIVLNQRGNAMAKGNTIPNFTYKYKGGLSNEINAFQKYVNWYAQDEEIDLQGYDIRNMIEDIEDVRKQFNYEQVALLGSSFGSQWALSYMQAHPERVERALLAGIEPIDFEYDDPKGVWSAIEKISAYAEVDPVLENQLPQMGLIPAVKEIVERLENQAQQVHLNAPKYGVDTTITVTADDFRNFKIWHNDRVWPKYITETYQGDYRLLALWVWENHHLEEEDRELMIGPLINNSLGISDERQKELDGRNEKKWLGDLNAYQKSISSIAPTVEIEDAFKQQQQLDIPILMIHGEIDRNTPYSNSLYLKEFFQQSHLIKVMRGGHQIKFQLLRQDPELAQQIFEFMNLNLNETAFDDYSAQLPRVYDGLENLSFMPLNGKSLFDQEMEDE